MKILLKYEIKRMLKSKEMMISLSVGFAICIWHLIQFVWFQRVYQGYDFPESFFQKWIGGHSFPTQSFLYYLILPLIAVLPGGATYFEDVDGGMIINIYLRCTRMKYLLAKYIAVFICGGLAFTLPLLLNLLFTAAHFPALLPEPITDIGPSLNYLFYQWYFCHPWLYLLLFLFLGFLFSGGFASISLAVSLYATHKAQILLCPFVLYFLIYCINNIIDTMNYAPNYFLISGIGIENILELIISFILFLSVFFAYLWKGLRYEL